MKTPLIMAVSLFALLTLSGCESMPDKVKDDGQAAAERAKQSAEKAYEGMKEDMK
jgi:starvation-inducible outer membrane lipoprotein